MAGWRASIGLLALTACGGLLEASEDSGMGASSPRNEAGVDSGAFDASTALDSSSRTDAAEYMDATGPEAGRDAAAPDPDASFECDGPGARFVTGVIAYTFGTGQSHNQTTGFPQALYGPPVAGDTQSVVSLGNGGTVTLEFASNAIVDGPGVDFIVFENPLPGFVELATVAVSDDGNTWHEFPCTAAQTSDDYGSCAGVARVLSRPDNGIDPLAPAVSGGDGFDLADLGVGRARYVRITDRVDLDGPAGVFDLDAVGIVNAACL